MLAHCHEVFFDVQNHRLVIALFFGALMGSITHCTGMCGPFVIAQVSGFSAPKGKQPGTWYRSLLLPYHLGRLTTYTVLGITATTLSAPLLHIHALHILSPLLLVIAGVLFFASAVSQVLPLRYFNFNVCGTPGWIMKRIVPSLPQNSLVSSYMLGILLGFLPCGLVYAAIIAVTATGNVAESALGMVAFAMGTMPMLMIISLGGKFLINRQYSWIKPISAVLMALNSMALFAMAGKGFV